MLSDFLLNLSLFTRCFFLCSASFDILLLVNIFTMTNHFSNFVTIWKGQRMVQLPTYLRLKAVEKKSVFGDFFKKSFSDYLVLTHKTHRLGFCHTIEVYTPVLYICTFLTISKRSPVIRYRQTCCFKISETSVQIVTFVVFKRLDDTFFLNRMFDNSLFGLIWQTWA